MSYNVRPVVRRLVLGTALCVALAVAGALRPAPVLAQAPAATAAAPADPATPAAPASAAAPTPPAKDAAKVRIEVGAGSDTEEDRARDRPRTVVIEKNGKRVRATGKGDDHEFDDVAQMFDKAPGMVAMIIAIVAIIFLSPALIVGLVIWYRVRKARMTNETMLKLAERGVVAPAVAMQALATGQPPGAIDPSAPTPPLADQAAQLRRQAAMGDLRKGVILGALGLALSVFSLLDDGTPNVGGLILLFLGIGYGALWWFEVRPGPRGVGSNGPGTGTPRA